MAIKGEKKQLSTSILKNVSKARVWKVKLE
jgi:hypothetical protein